MRMLVAVLLAAVCCSPCAGQVLFEDSFDDGLSDQWRAEGLKMSDYRVRNGALEMRVQTGAHGRDPPMLKVVLPFTSEQTVVASVRVTLLNDFSQEGEFAGLYLLDESGLEFGARQQRVADKLVFSPGDYRFVGKEGEEGDPSKYVVEYTDASPKAGPLRIVVDRGYGFFQVGPDADDKYLNFFYSALREKSKERGFCLLAAGAPEGETHWVRFDDFEVRRR